MIGCHCVTKTDPGSTTGAQQVWVCVTTAAAAPQEASVEVNRKCCIFVAALGLAAVNAASHLNQTQCVALSMLHSFPAPLLGFDPEVQQLKSSRRRRRRWQNKMKETTWWVLWTCYHLAAGYHVCRLDGLRLVCLYFGTRTIIQALSSLKASHTDQKIFCICIFLSWLLHCQQMNRTITMVVQNWHHIHLPWQQHHQQLPTSSLSVCVSQRSVLFDWQDAGETVWTVSLTS